MKKTSLKLPDGLWDEVKCAAVAWAESQGISTEGRTAAWVAKILKKAARDELMAHQLLVAHALKKGRRGEPREARS